MLDEARSIFVKAEGAIQLAHMAGHDVIPNPADPVCTHSYTNAFSTDSPCFEFNMLPYSRAEESCWFALPAPEPSDTLGNVLPADTLRTFWEGLNSDDDFVIHWSCKGELPPPKRWIGRKISTDQVRYKDPANPKADLKNPWSWPPGDDVVVHLVHHEKSHKQHKMVTRTIHDNQAATTSAVSDVALVRMLQSMTSDEFVRMMSKAAIRRTLHPSQFKPWAALLKHHCSDVVSAPAGDEFVTAFLVLLMLPMLYLDRKLKNQQLLKNLTRQRPHLPCKTKPPRADLDEDEKAIRLAQTYAAQGFISKACKALSKNKILDGAITEVHAALQSKHPQTVPFSAASPESVTFAFDPRDVELAIFHLTNGSAPCWSGWTKEVIKAATVSDPSILTDLGIISARLLDHSSNERLSDIIRAGKLLAMNNAKLADEIDPRPITISDTFTKILGTLCLA